MSWVVAQTVLMVAVIGTWFAPPKIHGGIVVEVVAALLAVIGAFIFFAARTVMGGSFTVRPQPRAGGELVTSGPFRFVRHPIYLSLLLFFTGLSLDHSWTGLALTGALAVLWAAKARVEERNLRARFPAYADYSRRVRYRLIPFVY